MDAPANPSQPPSRRQRRAALVAGNVLLVAGAALTPFASLPLPVMNGYIPAFCAAMLSINLILALLLYSRSVVEHTPSTRVLGAAYWFVALMFLPFMLTFPGALLPGEVVGTAGSVVWIWVFWHGGFGLAILRYSWLLRHQGLVGKSRRVLGSIVLTLLIALALSYIAIEWRALLPSLLSTNNKSLFEGSGQLFPMGILAIDALALLSLLRFKPKSTEQQWLCVGLAAACMDVWLTFHGLERYSLGWYVSKMGSALTSLAILMSLTMDQIDLYRRVARANHMLQTLARQDGLTGLANRRHFDEFLANEWSRCLREQVPLTLLMTDIDHFKRYNDHYGHLAGDACLRDIGKQVAVLVFRPGDLAARYGGEEFAVVLGNTSADGALATANRIKEGVDALQLAHAQSPFGVVTLSIGVATMVPTAAGSPTDLIAKADLALYQAKNTGRNRVVAAH